MRLLRRPAGHVEQAVAAERVRGLLRGTTVGWVPPPLDAPAAVPEEDAPAVVPQEDVPGGSVPPVGLPGRHAAPVEPWRASDDLEVRPDEDPAVPDLPSPAPPSGLAERLRRGRLDPGRRGVVGLALVGVLACLLAGLLVLRSAPEELALPTVEQAGRPIEGSTLPTPTASAGLAPGPASGPASGEVVVAVAGRVRRPGLVRLAAGSRVDDAVRAAGGLQPGASTGLLNLARTVVDGEQVLVGVEPPPGAVAAPGAGTPGGPPAPGGLVDLNSATAADLDRLPGIGPVLAERILEHRTRQGPFRSVDQLREVAGIGEAKFSSLRDAVTV